MHDIQSVVLLVLAAAILVRLADVAHVPAPIVLVLGGLGIALVPGLPAPQVSPEVVLFVFLPPLVHAAGWNASPQDQRTAIRPLAILVIGLVFATAAAIAVVAHELVGLGWAASVALGGALAPTDPVAAQATFRRLGAPDRLRLLVEGESMLNDATGLVVYRIAVGAAAGSSVSAADAVLRFVGNSAGGVAVGLAAGWLVTAVVRRQDDAALVTVLTVLGAYGSYIGAEQLHASGVLAAVVTGIYTGWQSPRALDADTRLSTQAFWRVGVFALEISLFVLLGLELPTIVDSLRDADTSLGALVGPAAAVLGATLAVRMAFVFAMGRDAGDTAGERFALGWSGMRGAVSLAAALAIPLDVAGRSEIVVIAFALILATLVVQGLTLPPIVRALRLEEPRRWSDEEAIARMEAAQAAIDRIGDLADEEIADERALGRLREAYERRLRICQAVLGGREDGAAAHAEARAADYAQLRRDLIGVERSTLLDLRSAGRLSQATLRLIVRDLDLEEARLSR
ncbi:MAG TPA: Na+/H+ antiporter [Solirubrobacteraceae bacterium]|nr:Na+/H+ antiporter [Solirubrobacteraceae bacterium]